MSSNQIGSLFEVTPRPERLRTFADLKRPDQQGSPRSPSLPEDSQGILEPESAAKRIKKD